jgi:DUF4097 and DUF4098 domain-containing protein YvlB
MICILIFIMVMTALMCYLGTRKQNNKVTTMTGINISVNGKEYKPGEDDIKIGDIKIHIENSKDVHIDVHGDIKSGGIETVSGCITAKNVSGNVSTLSGDIKISEGVTGNIKTMSGDVDVAGEIKGSINSMSGDITL